MNLNKEVAIFWFRNDLRVFDNPGLCESLKNNNVIPIYIYDNFNSKKYEIGSSSKWWLYHSLKSLNKSLNEKLVIYKGNPIDILSELSKRYNIKNIYWNRCYEPWSIIRDKYIKKTLNNNNIVVNTFNGSLLWEPWDILKKDGSPYKVFTPFYKKGCLFASSPRKPLQAPKLDFLISRQENSQNIDDLNLLSKNNWANKFKKIWQPGETHANKKLINFIKFGLKGYKTDRNFPAKNNVSKLSPHLHFGEISPNLIWYKINEFKHSISADDIDHFRSELGWREFSNYLLYHFPDLPNKNFQNKFDKFPWIDNKEKLAKWKRGLTGIPLVDAGMRELWQTGYIHNRVRMVVGSFLVKNLLIHWKEGEKWFWDCLVDADLASNASSWQWVAGSGADAAPYFRIFNPVTQGLKFDPNGEYTKKYVPELSKVPNKYLFNVWEAPKDILFNLGIVIGKDYPKPIIDIKESRELALESYKIIK